VQEDAVTREDVSAYIDLYNQANFERAVGSYFTQDAEFWNTRIALRGAREIIDWLVASHSGYAEKVTPTSLIVESDGAAIELGQEFRANADISHFFIRPLKKGELLRTRGICWFFRLRNDKICAAKEYRLLYRCDQAIFMADV
jgi:hypothetical protein